MYYKAIMNQPIMLFSEALFFYFKDKMFFGVIMQL